MSTATTQPIRTVLGGRLGYVVDSARAVPGAYRAASS